MLNRCLTVFAIVMVMGSSVGFAASQEIGEEKNIFLSLAIEAARAASSLPQKKGGPYQLPSLIEPVNW